MKLKHIEREDCLYCKKEVGHRVTYKNELHVSKEIRWVAYDLETSCLHECCWGKGKDGKIICWVLKANTGEKWWGWRKGEFIRLIKAIAKNQPAYKVREEKRKRKVYFWAHNALKFDLIFFIDDLIFQGAKKVNKYGVFWENVVFFDSWNIANTKLEYLPTQEKREEKRLGKNLFNRPEYHQDPYPEEYLDEMLNYCDNDVEILADFIGTLPTYKKGSRAALAMYMLRKEHINHWDFKKYFPSFNCEELDEKREFIEKGYRGGVYDLFNEKELPDIYPHSIDMNSAYAYAMRNCPMPIGKGQWLSNSFGKFNQLGIDPKAIYDGNQGFIGMYHLKINSLRMKEEWRKKNIPPLVYVRNEYGVMEGRSWLPKGSDYYALGNEINFILKYYDCDYAIINGLIFRTKIGIFTSYIDAYFPIKQQLKREMNELEDKGERIPYEIKVKHNLAKAMLTSLYGKFAQKVWRQEEVFKNFGRKPKDDKIHYLLHPKTKDYYKFVPGELKRTRSFNYSPISAVTTAYVRIMVWEEAIKQTENLLAIANDGMVLKQAPTGVCFGEGLGQWREENDYGKGWDSSRGATHQWILGDKYKGLGENAKAEPMSDGRYRIVELIWYRYSRAVRIKKVIKITRPPEENPKRRLKDGKWTYRDSVDFTPW